MVQKCFVYVVLASIISSRVIAAPTAQVSSDPEPPTMCDDITIPWQDRIKVCSVCDIPGVPRGVYIKYCGEDSPGTHGRADGVWRRDGAADAISDEPEDKTMGIFDNVVHKPASGVWRRSVVTLPAAPIVHGHASDVSDGGNEPLNGRRSVVTLPAAPIVHGHASGVSDGGNEPLNGRKRDVSLPFSR